MCFEKYSYLLVLYIDSSIIINLVHDDTTIGSCTCHT